MLNIAGLRLPMIGDQIVTGDVRFVDENADSSVDDPGQGKRPEKTFNTLDYAIGKMTANKGDFIIVQPGHTETGTAAADWALDIAGLSIIGLGNMDLRPTLTLGTSTDCDFNVSAANCRIKNIKFVSAINSLKNFLDLDVGTFIAEHCHFVTANTLEVVTFVDIADTMDNFRFSDCEFIQPTDPDGTDGNAGTGGIYCQDTEHILIENCRFFGYFESAIIHNKTTLVHDLHLRFCEITNHLIQPFILVADSTGSAFQCYGETRIGSDVTDAELFGTIGNYFWLNDCHMGNDHAGGMMGAPGTIAT